MKKTIIFVIVVLVVVGIAFGISFFHARPAPEQVFRANLTEAQKVLVTLRRAETAYHESSQGYKDVFARMSGGKMIYSEGWSAMKLPNVEAGTGFDYECLSAQGSCQATEAGKTAPSGNGIKIDIKTGAYVCLGTYQPVTTEGFDGTEVTVGCRE